jgi:hypothetical protein
LLARALNNSAPRFSIVSFAGPAFNCCGWRTIRTSFEYDEKSSGVSVKVRDPCMIDVVSLIFVSSVEAKPFITPGHFLNLRHIIAAILEAGESR